MFRIATQVRELISSNITSALDSATNPAKMLARLQREIEDALIGLTGEMNKAQRQQDRLAAELSQALQREADWGDKARIAMDHGREDLARQALLAREDCRNGIASTEQDSDRLAADIAAMDAAVRELGNKRADVMARLADQRAAEGDASDNVTRGGFASRTEQRMDTIADLEKRTEFAAAGAASGRSEAAINREIEEMRRDRAIDAELAAMRNGATAAKPATSKSGRSKKGS